MKIKPYTIEKRPKKGWNQIFKEPIEISLETFKTGTVSIERRSVINPEHSRAGYIQDDIIDIPILAHLVHHKTKGYYLIDTGLDALYTDDPKGGIIGESADEYTQCVNENIKHHLDQRRVKLEGVFLSHLHSDHIAGARELPNDIPYITGKGELEDYQPEIYGDFLKDVKTVYEIDYSNTNEFPFLGHCADVLGDGSLWAVSTPGHTCCHTSFIVNGCKGPILLTMDAAFINDNIKLGIGPRDYTDDVEKAQKTLEKLLDFLREFPQVKLITGHEIM